MINTTFAKINYEVEGKEYIIQKTKYEYRCISWHPHYIMTQWKKSKKEAIEDADYAIKNFYSDK